MVKFAYLLGLGLLASVAEAKEVTFYFDVHSSGPEIYPCDAGLIQVPGEKFCHFKGSKEKCDPLVEGMTPFEAGTTSITTPTGEPLNTKEPAHACICTGGAGIGGDYLMNFMRYKAAVWQGAQGSDNANHMGWSAAKQGTVSGSKVGATVAQDVHKKFSNSNIDANDTKQELSTQLESVTFFLGSELYGAQYFVDLCYRGPQLPYFVNKANENVKTNFATVAYVKGTNPFVSGDAATKFGYVKLSGVAMNYEMVCDFQGEGSYKFDHNGKDTDEYASPDGVFDQLDNDIVDENVRTFPEKNKFGFEPLSPPAAGATWVGNLLGDKVPFKTSGMPEGIVHKGYKTNADLSATDAKYLFGSTEDSLLFVKNSPKAPRFCKLRYYFAEKPFLDRERAWQRHDARFFVKWAVEEAEASAM